eukprot:4825019-Pyramimonas_sp.AAC.1
MTEAPAASPATQGFWTKNLTTTDDDHSPCSLSMVELGERREALWNRAQMLMVRGNGKTNQEKKKA